MIQIISRIKKDGDRITYTTDGTTNKTVATLKMKTHQTR